MKPGRLHSQPLKGGTPKDQMATNINSNTNQSVNKLKPLSRTQTTHGWYTTQLIGQHRRDLDLPREGGLSHTVSHNHNNLPTIIKSGHN